MTVTTMHWPDTADGDVFRRLQSSGFDFSQVYAVDFNVDFKPWPPSPMALQLLQQKYGKLTLHPPEGNSLGYVQFQIVGKLSYELVISTQAQASQEMASYGGVCESWGVLQSPTQ